MSAKFKINPITRWASGIVLVAAMLSFPLKSADAALYKRFSVGAWKGGIYTNNKTGEFSHCAVSARYKSGITLFFSVTRSLNWQVGFSKGSWKLDVGKSYPVRYQVDRRSIKTGKAKAISSKLITINLPATSRLFTQMRRGRVLKVEAGKDLLKFNLTGTSKMLIQLLNCSKRNANLVVNQGLSASDSGSANENPFASNGQSGSRKQPVRTAGISPNFRNEARGWLKNTLIDRGVAVKVVANKGKAQKLYKKNAIVWRDGEGKGIIGSLRIIPSREPDNLINRVLADEARLCKGDFASKFVKDDNISSIKVEGLLTTCNLASGKFWNAYFALARRDLGGTYLVTLLTSRASTSDIADAGDRLTGAMQTTQTTVQSNVDETDIPIRDGDVTRY